MSLRNKLQSKLHQCAGASPQLGTQLAGRMASVHVDILTALRLKHFTFHTGQHEWTARYTQS